MAFHDKITDFFRKDREVSNSPGELPGDPQGATGDDDLSEKLDEILDRLRKMDDRERQRETEAKEAPAGVPPEDAEGRQEGLGDKLNRTGQAELPDGKSVVWGLQGHGGPESDVDEQSGQSASVGAAKRRQAKRRAARGEEDPGVDVHAEEGEGEDIGATKGGGDTATKLDQFHELLLDTQTKVTEIHTAIKEAES